jgi:creatinine amidohydrolase
VDAIANAVEKRMGERVLLLPVLWLGSSHHHMDFPGTLSIRPSLYAHLIRDLTTSILRAGFQRIFFLNGHGGNETPTSQAISELIVVDELAARSLLAMASWWAVGKPRPEQHNLTTAAISHACEYESSLMLSLRPDLVEIARAHNHAPGFESTWLSGEKRVLLYRRFAFMTATGSLGSPTAATAAKGDSLLSAVVDDVVAFLDEFAKWPLPSILAPVEVHA